MDPDFYQLQSRQRVITPKTEDGVVMLQLRPLVEEEVMRAMKVSTPMNLNRAVRQEVFQLFEDRTLVEALLGHRLRGELRAEFLQDQYRKEASQVPSDNSECRVVMKSSGFASPEVVESGRTKQVAEIAQVARLSERMDLVTNRLEAADGVLKNTQESLERLKAHHLKVFDGKAKEVLAELRQENTRFAEGIWSRLDRLEKELEMTVVPRLEAVERHHSRHASLSTEVSALHNAVQELRDHIAPKVVSLEQRHATEVHSKAEDLRREFLGELAALDFKHFESRSKAEEEIRRELRMELAALDHKHLENRSRDDEDIRREIHVEIATQAHKHFEGKHAGSISAAKEEMRRDFRAELAARPPSDDLQKIAVKSDQAVSEQSKRLELVQKQGEVRHASVEASVKELQAQLHGLQQEQKILATKPSVDGNIAAVEKRLWEALQEHTAQIGRRLDLSQEEADRRHCDYAANLEKRDGAAEARLRDAMEVQERLGEELRVYTNSVAQLRDQDLPTKLTAIDQGSTKTTEEMRSHFETHIESLTDELKVKVDKGDNAIGGIERRLDAVLQEHAAGIERLETQLKIKVAETDKRHQTLEEQMAERTVAAGAMNMNIEARLQELLEAPQVVSRECAHRLHAVAYSLLEVIGEVELTGSGSEAREKRIKLHQHLCDRLGAVRPVTPRQRAMNSVTVGPAMLEGSEAKSLALPPSRPRSSSGRKNPKREQLEMEDLVKSLEAKSFEMRASMRSTTPRSTKKVLHGLRDVRTMRLMDYSTFDETDSRPSTSPRF